MLGGVDIGRAGKKAQGISLTAAALSACTIEIWIDDIGEGGKHIATIPVTATHSLANWRKFSARIMPLMGQHDLYIKIKGPSGKAILKSANFY